MDFELECQIDRKIEHSFAEVAGEAGRHASVADEVGIIKACSCGRRSRYHQSLLLWQTKSVAPVADEVGIIKACFCGRRSRLLLWRNWYTRSA